MVDLQREVLGLQLYCKLRGLPAKIEKGVQYGLNQDKDSGGIHQEEEKKKNETGIIFDFFFLTM